MVTIDETTAPTAWGEPRSRTVTWHDPRITAAGARQRTGLETMEAIRDGVLPPPPIAMLMQFGIGSLKEGRVEFTCDVDESVYNPIGVVHGGLVCTLLDTVAGCAVHTTLPAGFGYTSIELKVNYLRAVHATSGPLTADRHGDQAGTTGRVRRGRGARRRRQARRQRDELAAGLPAPRRLSSSVTQGDSRLKIVALRADNTRGIGNGGGGTTVGSQESQGTARSRRPLSRRAQNLCIAALTVALLALAGWLMPGLVDLPPYLSHVALPWWAMALAFAATDVFVLNVQARRETQTISLSEIPLVLGLYFASPLALIVGRALGSAAAMIGYRRSPPLKITVNLALILSETAIAIALFRALSPDATRGRARDLAGRVRRRVRRRPHGRGGHLLHHRRARRRGRRAVAALRRRLAEGARPGGDPGPHQRQQPGRHARDRLAAPGVRRPPPAGLPRPTPPSPNGTSTSSGCTASPRR